MLTIYRARETEGALRRALAEKPCVFVCGARGVGKTTLVREMLATHRYVSFEDGFACALARRAPAVFLDRYVPPVVLDDIHRVPELVSRIGERMAAAALPPGSYVLAGNGSLAGLPALLGEAAGSSTTLEVFPFTWREIRADPRSSAELVRRLLLGFYPQPAMDGMPNVAQWLDHYLEMVVMWDVCRIKRVSDSRLFVDFLTRLALGGGKHRPIVGLAEECGISEGTVREWLRLAESVCLLRRLPPYRRHRWQRSFTTSDYFFVDSGIACRLNGLSGTTAALSSPRTGWIFASMVYSEALKRAAAWKGRVRLAIHRDEFDPENVLVVTNGRRRHVCTVRFTASPTQEMGRVVARSVKRLGCQDGAVLCVTGTRVPLGRGIWAESWWNGLDRIFA